jgi:flagellar FliL protein
VRKIIANTPQGFGLEFRSVLCMAENKEEAKAPKKPLNLVLIGQLVFAVINLGMVGIGAYFIYASTLGWRAPQITEQQLAEQHEKEVRESSQQVGPLVYTMDKFTVNLAGDPLRDPRRTIQLEVNLDMLNKEGFEEVINNDLRAKARDKIIQILGNKSYAEVETIQGKLFLKDQIAMELNSILDKGVVKDVYFTNFVVQ